MRGRRAITERTVSTVLFTDIGGSTEIASRLGDRRWRDVLKAHHAAVRRQLKRHGGVEVDTAGDGFFALFDQPARAVRCAVNLCDDIERLGLQIRAGVHVGEVEPVEKGVGGIAVHIGARVAAKADPGEIFVSGTVRDLMSGSDVVFSDRGVHPLKGVSGEWRLYSVVREPVEAPAEFAIPSERRQSRRPLVIGLVIGALVVAGTGATVLALRDHGGLKAGPGTVAFVGSGVERVVTVTDPASLAIGGGSVWAVSKPPSNTLVRIDPAGHATTTGLAGGPTGIAYGAGSVWITSQFGQSGGTGGSLVRYTPTSSGLTKSAVTAPLGISAVAFGADSIWVADRVTGEVLRIDPRSNEFTGKPIAAGRDPIGIAFGSGSVWVVDGLGGPDRAGALIRIDPNTSTTLTIPLLSVPSAVAADDTTVWVLSKEKNAVYRIDPATNRSVTLPPVAQPSAVAAFGGQAWIGSGTSVLKFDASRTGFSQRVEVGGPVTALAPERGGVWAAIGRA